MADYQQYNLDAPQPNILSEDDVQRIIRSTLESYRGRIVSGAGTKSMTFDPAQGIWLGGDAFSGASFSVTMGGVLTATGATISGAISASTIDIGGADATSFHVDVDGNMWLGAATFADGVAKISKAGVLTAAGAIINGSTIDGTSTLNGSLTSLVQPRAEVLFKKFAFIGSKDDGLIEYNSGTGTITRELVTTTIVYTTGANGSAIYGYVNAGANPEITWDTDFEVVVYAKLLATGANAYFFIGLIDNAPAFPGGGVGRSIGFEGHNTICNAHNADNSAQTNTVTGTTNTNWNTYRFVYTHGVSALFYVNDVLKATHTTNLPSGSSGNIALNIFVTDTTPDVSRTLYVANGYVLIATQP